MARRPDVFKTPNAVLEKAIQETMDRIKVDKPPLEVVVKVLNTAIAWEKVKHAIKSGDGDTGYDPDEDDPDEEDDEE